MPVRVDLRITENRRNPVFKPLRNEVFQAFGFVVHLVPGVLQHVMKKQFKQPVTPDQFPCPAFASGGQPDAPVFLVANQDRALRRKLLKHSRH